MKPFAVEPIAKRKTAGQVLPAQRHRQHFTQRVIKRFAFTQGRFGARPLEHLASQFLICRFELAGALADALFQRFIERTNLPFGSLPGERIHKSLGDDLKQLHVGFRPQLFAAN